jgi:hypothetical protein
MAKITDLEVDDTPLPGAGQPLDNLPKSAWRPRRKPRLAKQPSPPTDKRAVSPQGVTTGAVQGADPPPSVALPENVDRILPSRGFCASTSSTRIR